MIRKSVLTQLIPMKQLEMETGLSVVGVAQVEAHGRRRWIWILTGDEYDNAKLAAGLTKLAFHEYETFYDETRGGNVVRFMEEEWRV